MENSKITLAHRYENMAKAIRLLEKFTNKTFYDEQEIEELECLL